MRSEHRADFVERFSVHARRADRRDRNAPVGTTGPGIRAVPAASGTRAGQRRSFALARSALSPAGPARPRHRADRPGGGLAAQRAGLPCQPRRGVSRWGDFERAAGCCRVALSISPNYPEALCNLARPAGTGAVRRVGRIAPPCLGAAAKLRGAHKNLGIGLRELKQADEALEHFKSAVELDPAFVPAQTNLGQMLLDLGHADLALPHSQEAARLDPNSAVLHHNLGNGSG